MVEASWHAAARFVLITVTFWFTARLLLSLLFGRILHGKVHIGRVGWFSLNKIEWHVIKHTKVTTSTRIQTVHIDRLGFVLRNKGAKDGDARGVGWIGIAASGVRIKAALVPCRQDPEAEGAGDLDHIDGGRSDAAGSGPTAARGHSDIKDPATGTPDPTAGLKKLVWSFLAAVSVIHDLRRNLRRSLVAALPIKCRKRLARDLRVIRHSFITPVLTHVNAIARSCNIISHFIAVEVSDIVLSIPRSNTSVSCGLLRFGVDLTRGKNSYIGAWLRVEKLDVAAVGTAISSESVKASPEGLRTALALPGPLILEGKAVFDPAIGMAGLYHRNLSGKIEPRKCTLDLAAAFIVPTAAPKSKGHIPTSIYLNVKHLIELELCVKSSMQPRPHPHFGPHLGPHLHSRDGSETGDTDSIDEATRVIEPISARQNPLALLKSFRLTVPLIVAETEVSKTGKMENGYFVDAALRGVAIELEVGGTARSTDKHVDWFGRNAALKGTAKLGFEKLETNIKTVLHKSSKGATKIYRILDVSASGAHLSSSWLPPRLDALFSSNKHHEDAHIGGHMDERSFGDDMSESRVIVEADMGGVSGESCIDMVDDLVQYISSIKSRNSPSSLSTEDPGGHSAISSVPDGAPRLHDPPAISLALELGKSGFRLFGPRHAHRTAFGPGEDDAGKSTPWQASSVLCFNLPSASLHLNTEVMDIAFHRSPARLRDWNELLRRGRVPCPEILLPYLPEDFQRTAAARDKRSHSLSCAKNGSSILGRDGVSESVSPKDSPGPRDRLHHQQLLDDGSGFVSPEAPTGEAPAVASVPFSQETSHAFYYKVRAALDIERVEVYLLVTSAAGSVYAPWKSAETKSGQGLTGFDPQRAGHVRSSSKSLAQVKHDILSIGTITAAIMLDLSGQPLQILRSLERDPLLQYIEFDRREGSIMLQVHSIEGDLSKMDVYHALNGIITTGSNARLSLKSANHSQGESASQPVLDPGPSFRPLAELLPPDIFFVLSVNAIELHVAGPDPKYNPEVCRGLALQTASIVFEAWRQTRTMPGQFSAHQRASLGLKDDIRTHANAQIATLPDVPQTFFRMFSTETAINPLKDAQNRSRDLRNKYQNTSATNYTDTQETSWDLRNRDRLSEGNTEGDATRPNGRAENDFFWMPSLTFRFCLWSSAQAKQASASRTAGDHGPRQVVDNIGLTITAPTMTARLELFQVYCFLLALSALRSLRPRYSIPPTPASQDHHGRVGRPRPCFIVHANFPILESYITLPHNARLFARFSRVKLDNADNAGISLKFETATLAGASIASPGLWDDIIRLREVFVSLRDELGNSAAQHGKLLSVSAAGGRLRLPFKYPFSIIIENTATFIKTVKQLSHQFLKGKYNMVIEPSPEGPKRLPRIKVAMRILVLEAADDPFETKLNLIWRAGVEEQSQRLGRERAFEDKVSSMKISESQNTGEHEESNQDKGHRSRSRSTLKPADAYAVLQSIHSTKWIKRHKNAVATRKRREENQLRRLYGSIGHSSGMSAFRDSTLPIQLASVTGTAPLLRWAMENTVLEISRPSFSDTPNGLESFLADVGKGMPRDTQYTLLVPFHLNWEMSEARIHLRDYPLPMLYIPPVQQPQSEAKSFQLSTDFVIAEEVGPANSIRYVPATIVPRELAGSQQNLPYILQVPRTAMPIKTYALPEINITSTWATRIGWGNSIQPTIQDVMRVIDSLTKAPPDPSERMGFWDKLRLILHWRIAINFLGEGPLHFILKGSRNPYSLQGPGAGFALCWSGNVRWTMGFPNDDREFFQIRSDTFLLGIPDLKDYVDAAATGVIRENPASADPDERSQASGAWSEAAHLRAYRRDQSFEKICAKFLGGVQWGLGLQMERTCTDVSCTKRPKCTGRNLDRQCRFFTFRPHYEVKTIAGADHPYEKDHDSFAGFRSDFLHFSISVVANNPDSPAKSIHLTPVGFTHFWAWWHLFDGTMSLPVRHGPLFPSTQAASKKFGKHCATIKYRAQLSPVYIAHTYKQESGEAWHRGFTTVLGIKGRIGTFNVDLHQREQEESVYSEGLQTTRTRLHKAFFRAEVDCIDTDMRVVSARFTDLHKPLVHADADSDEEEDTEDPFNLESAPPIADDDLPWVDLDDFYDLYISMPDPNPNLRIVPCFKSPRLTYTRYSQAANPDSTDDIDHRKAQSKFGNEGTHSCLLGHAKDAVEVQLGAMEARIQELRSEIRYKSRASTRHTVQEVDDLQMQLSGAIKAAERFRAYRKRRQSIKTAHDESDDPQYKTDSSQETGELKEFEVFDDLHLWINRLVIHNPNMVVTQNIRDVLLRYYYSSMNRRLFEYALSTRALKFIRELGNGHTKTDSRLKARRTRSRRPQTQRLTSEHAHEHETHTDLLEKMLNDEGVNWSFTERPRAGSDRDAPDNASQSSEGSYGLDPHHEAANDLADHWGVRNSFVISLLKPQVALESVVTESATVIVTANSMQFRVFNIVDEKHVDDPINSQVMHRSFASIDALQAFYPHVKGWRSGQREKALSSLRFVPLEVLAGCVDDPRNLDRIVPCTSARLRYDKHNRLRLLNNTKGKHATVGKLSKGSNLDKMVVICDRFSVSATPKHYTAIYDVITTLILHTDPGQKARNQKIERVVLSKDFSDRQDIALGVSRQQDEIRAIRSQIMTLIYTGHHELSESAVMNLYLLSADLLRRMEIISMWMGAIQRSQDSKNSGRSMGMQLDARANEIVWHMRDHEETPPIKVAVKGVAFRWLNRSDGSVANCLLISDLLALNSSPEQYFSEIIAKQPAQGADRGLIGRQEIFVAILWSMLSPVGGINVIERFEVHLHPIRLQLEQRVGKHIMNYLFAQRSARKKQADEDSGRADAVSTSKPSAVPAIRRQASSIMLRSTKSTESLPQSRNSLEIPTAVQTDAGQRLLVPKAKASSMASDSSIQTRPVSLRRVSSSETLAMNTGKTDDYLDAEEMRERARLNRAFHHVEVFPTVLTISFKGEKSTSLPDLYGLVYKSPTVIHCNRIWTYLELLEHIKRDFKSSIWSQSATLIGQLLTTARKPKNVVQHHVQHRLLGLGDRDKSDEQRKKRSFSSSLRARMTSGNGDHHKASPLRASLIRAGSGQAADDSEGEERHINEDNTSDDLDSRNSQERQMQDGDQDSFDFSSESGTSPAKRSLFKAASRAS